ncbi:MAG: glycosyltransferase [Acidobacteria bacterium]|nr:glycosyltransferase [Acidobacteriota bacterium]
MVDQSYEVSSSHGRANSSVRRLQARRVFRQNTGHMNIWLLKIGEPVPVVASFKERLHRCGMLTDYLSEGGHNATWWTSTFDRIKRENLYERDVVVNPKPGLTIRLLHSPGYSQSLSLARIRDQRHVAKKFLKHSQGLLPPDLILSAYPTIDLCKAAIVYGNRHGIPVILDMRDMWPDIIFESVPRAIRLPARILTWPMMRDSRFVCSKAFAITGITEEFVQWGLHRGNRQRTPLDSSFPLAFSTKVPPAKDLEAAQRFWDQMGVGQSEQEFIVCFIGTLGHQFDLGPVIHAARILKDAGRRVRFVICGSGDLLESHRKAVCGDDTVLFPGWIDAAKLYSLLRRASVGLDPVPDRYDFLSTINNKAIEYFSAGLPVISSPKRGVLFELLHRENCGFSYATGNAEELALHISRLMDDPLLLGRMSENSQRSFHSSFDADRVYRGMIKHLEKVVKIYKGQDHSEESRKKAPVSEVLIP